MQILAHSDGRHRFVVEGPARYPFLVDAEHNGSIFYGPRPQELLLESLACCLGVTALAVLEKKRVNAAGLIVKVDGQQSAERPHDYISFHVHVEGAGADLSETTLARTAELADRNCPVSRTLAKGVPITISSAVLTAEQLLERLGQAPAAALSAAAEPAVLAGGLTAFERALAELVRAISSRAPGAYALAWQLQLLWMQTMAAANLRSQAVGADLGLLRGLIAAGSAPGVRLVLQGGQVRAVERLLGLEATGVRFVDAGLEQLLPLDQLVAVEP